MNIGNGYIAEANGEYSQGSVVLEKCYGASVLGIRVRNPTTNGWAGSVKYSQDGGQTYVAMYCASCKQETSTEIIYVDLDLPTKESESDGKPGYANCIGGATCDIVEAI